MRGRTPITTHSEFGALVRMRSITRRARQGRQDHDARVRYRARNPSLAQADDLRFVAIMSRGHRAGSGHWNQEENPQATIKLVTESWQMKARINRSFARLLCAVAFAAPLSSPRFASRRMKSRRSRHTIQAQARPASRHSHHGDVAIQPAGLIRSAGASRRIRRFSRIRIETVAPPS